MVAECGGRTILSAALGPAARGSRPTGAPMRTTGVTRFSTVTSPSW